MALDTLKDVYIDQLQDLYSANRQALTVTRELAEAAANDQLKQALKRGVTGIEDGVEKVGSLIKTHGADPTGEFCEGMQGLVREARADALEAEVGNADVRDAMIITQYQRLVHYAIAGYASLATLARRLDFANEAGLLQDCLDKTYHGDSEMSRIAISEVNREAV
ncbi:MAG: ferritin-like domain-containing protein [Alphaproteobacteria bacterium]